MKTLIKKYLKSLTKDKRDFRLLFRGRRLQIKQYRWLHFKPSHPWEDKE